MSATLFEKFTWLLVGVGRFLCVLGVFLLFYLGAAIFSWIGIPLLVILVRNLEKRTRIVRWFIHKWCRAFILYINVMGLVDFKLERLGNELPSGPLIIISNHPSLLDVVIFLALYPDLCCIIKRSLFRDPFVGLIMRQANYISGEGGGPFSGSAAVITGIRRLNTGQKIIIFPEGTRSPLDGLCPFLGGAFEMSVRAAAPVLPFILTSNPLILNKKVPWCRVFFHSSCYSLTQLPVLDPLDWSGDSISMKAHIEELYHEKLSGTP